MKSQLNELELRLYDLERFVNLHSELVGLMSSQQEILMDLQQRLSALEKRSRLGIVSRKPAPRD